MFGLFGRRKNVEAPLIVVAPDKFKGTMSARDVCAIVGRAIREIMPQATVRLCPMADGGEGTSDILGNRLGLSRQSEYVDDALGRSRPSVYFSNNETVALDSAAVIGLWKIEEGERCPLSSSSYSLGWLVGRLIGDGAKRINLGIGGTATVDCGAGFLQALGARYFMVDGTEIAAPITADRLGDVFSIDFSGLNRHRLRGILRGLADVDVPLAGMLDYAPQKGVASHDMDFLRTGVENFRRAVDEALMPASVETPFAGAGGGLGYALGRVLGCSVEPGAEHILGLYGIFSAEEKPRLIVTGEGCLDSQTLSGKALWTVYRAAARHNIPVLGLVGCNRLAELPEGLDVVETEPFLRGQTLNRNRALQTLDVAARQSLAAICARMWG